ncbi:MAG: MFS transporter [Xanthomonadaceae bacterium]|nr:MFS transporter [Xanthomonadaceae bacterium]
MSQFRLLGTRRFAPYFATQALAAFNDNAFRQATVILIGFQLGLGSGAVSFYSNLAPALFILPFFLFSASAGQLAERVDKARMIRAIKLFEIAAMALATWGFAQRSPALLLAVLFLMGLHSTLFGPIKYSILPQVLRPEELVGGNGLVESGTSLAILVGMIAGGAAMDLGGTPGVVVASALVLTVALLGLAASFAIPALRPAAPGLAFNWNPVSETRDVLRLLARDRGILHAVLGISWFWFIGGVFTAQLPNYTTQNLGGTASVAILALALFSIGVGVGSLWCERLSGHQVEIGLVPLGAIGLTAFGADLYAARPGAPAVAGLDAWHWLRAAGNAHVALDLTLIGLSAGLYIVPLFAQVQARAAPQELSRIIAGNNVVNALFLVLAAVLALGLLRLGLSVPQLFLVVALMNAAVAAYIFVRSPEYVMRFITWVLVHTLYRVRLEGLERIPAAGPALLVCNHVSYMDALILMASVRRPVRFVMDDRIFRIPLLRFVFRIAHAIPIAGAKEDPHLLASAFDAVDAALAAGELVCIFPEGGLTRDGAIAPFRPGVETMLARRPVPVVPLALRGLWGSVFSRRDSALGRARLPRRFRSRIGLVAGTPLSPPQATLPALEQAVRDLRGAWA